MAVWVALFGLLMAVAAAQQDAAGDEADPYAIPGDPAGETVPGGGSAATEYANLLHKLIAQGGWAIWPLLGLSVAVVGLSIYCLIDLREGRFFPAKVLGQLREDADHADLKAVRKHAEQSRSSLGQVMAGAAEFIEDRDFQVLDDNALYDAMADASQECNRGRARTINYFSAIAQAAPMLGLLGTVSGMIKAFDKLGQTGLGDPAELADNISEALWTTATGLVIAVPTLFIYFYFRDRLTALISKTDRHAFRTLNSLRKAVVTRASGAAGQPEGL